MDALSPDLRPISFTPQRRPARFTGSVLVSFGNTRVICAATVEENVPGWMKFQGVEGGWVSAEYSMLPYSTHDRKSARHQPGQARWSLLGDPAPHRPLAPRRH